MVTKITCPECDKTFKTETSLNWHLEHIHAKAQSETNSDGPVEDMITARLNIFTKRNAWLSSRIEKLEAFVTAVKRRPGDGILLLTQDAFDSVMEKWEADKS